MRKSVHRISARSDGLDELRGLALLQGIEERLFIHITDRLEYPEREARADHGSGCEDLAARLADPLQTAPDDETYSLGHVELFGVQIRAPHTGLVKQATFFVQVPEDFLHEERVAFRFVVDGVDERLWRRRTTQCG